jgi:hypothetical protein
MRMNNDLLGKLSIVSILSIGAVLATTSLTACKGDDGDDSATDETGDGDGDGDPTGDGDGDGDPTGDGDGDPTGDGDGDPTGDGDGDPVCTTHDPGDGAANGESCATNGECASKLCEVFQDVPAGDGTCEPAPDGCRTRIMGRVLDFTTRDTVADADLRVAQAIQASVNPGGAPALASGTSNAQGIIDTTSDGQITSPLGIVGLTVADGFYLTATGLASPAEGTNYGPANAIHDIWVVPNAAVTAWSGYLENDPDFVNELPLGDAGGVVGLVRSASTGAPIAGAVVVANNPDTSDAAIRFLNAAGDGFNAEETSSQGVFVIVNPGLGETFGVEIDGVKVAGISGTAGSANGAVFTLIMNIPE